jgi:hypothetical protein
MKPTRCVSVIMILAGTAISAPRPTMTIRVLDQANLPANKIQKMERYVEATLAAIQIDVKWVDCATDVVACQALRRPNEFWVRILSQMPPAINGRIDLLGFAQFGDTPEDRIQCVNVFYPMVEQFSESERAGLHQVLGAAVVHEIGHLYLGRNREAHSSSGVMCGVWLHREFELLSIGELNFTSEQGARIRAAMSIQENPAPRAAVIGYVEPKTCTRTNRRSFMSNWMPRAGHGSPQHPLIALREVIRNTEMSGIPKNPRVRHSQARSLEPGNRPDQRI